MTTTYVILLPGDESRWESASAEHRAAMYGVHQEFSDLLAARGHKVTGGAELTHSREAKVVRRTGDSIDVTDGPYAESVEQLTGFYLVESDDLDDLLRIASMLGGEDGAVEVRAAVDHSGSDA
ncbi:MAG TPA: YciI family protein [Nocardioides sp.]|uniref:YciI family protein n=1 Tax=Nocardioides sp. TaxID=35761 RepID=UPI002D80F538|nr:YciI family protein [Nocardioides sp.]HET6653988.1 YciI family protein [Nocardioides sp.]